MIQISCKADMYTYDMYHITKAFYPNETIRQTVNEEQKDLVQLVLPDGSTFTAGCDVVQPYKEKREQKHVVNRMLYRWLVKVTDTVLSWGILTGIRPTKIMMNRLEQGTSEDEIRRWMEETYFVTPQKARLGMEIAVRERELLKRLDYEDGYSLYVGIPFCPTTCSYCSFTSWPMERFGHLADAYLDALCRELTWIGNAAREKQKTINTVYVGGGTPTTLTPEQLERLLTHMETTFSYDRLKEITVEAGRPDSITEAKLRVLRKHGISRISVNPQTMQQRTLDTIGRRHTVADIINAYETARKLGFDNINMDLIAGLPGETLPDMEDTLRQIRLLSPDSLTVHSLAVKRASKMGQEGADITDGRELSQMIECAAAYAKEMDMVPYYMYRQKNMAGNFENVGYAKVDKAGIYNILIMEEKQSILAAGAGASTKIVRPLAQQQKIVRVENVKDVPEYISRVDEMIERKGEWLWR